MTGVPLLNRKEDKAWVNQLFSQHKYTFFTFLISLGMAGMIKLLLWIIRRFSPETPQPGHGDTRGKEVRVKHGT
jgi:hypothetical protein